MADIYLGNIVAKVEQYAQTKAGQRKMNAKIKEYIDNGVDRTQAGSIVPTTKWMDYVTGVFADLLRTVISTYAGTFPMSVMENLDSLTYDEPETYNGRYSASYGYISHVYFEDSLTGETKRASMYELGYPEGIDDIISLFNTGYHAKNRVYGIWHGHTAVSLDYRVGVHFLERAIQEFNMTFAAQYGVIAYMNDLYDRW